MDRQRLGSPRNRTKAVNARVCSGAPRRRRLRRCRGTRWRAPAARCTGAARQTSTQRPRRIQDFSLGNDDVGEIRAAAIRLLLSDVVPVVAQVHAFTSRRNGGDHEASTAGRKGGDDEPIGVACAGAETLLTVEDEGAVALRDGRAGIERLSALPQNQAFFAVSVKSGAHWSLLPKSRAVAKSR